MSSKAYERTLTDWAKQWETENIDAQVRKLINLADFDLHYGPVSVHSYEPENEWSEYPGFISACDKIKEALHDLPSRLYIDAECEDWQTSEPEPTACETCHGRGEVEHYMTDDNEIGHDVPIKCNDCLGTGAWEVFGDYWQLERLDLVKKIVGKELSEYVR